MAPVLHHFGSFDAIWTLIARGGRQKVTRGLCRSKRAFENRQHASHAIAKLSHVDRSWDSCFDGRRSAKVKPQMGEV